MKGFHLELGPEGTVTNNVLYPRFLKAMSIIIDRVMHERVDGVPVLDEEIIEGIGYNDSSGYIYVYFCSGIAACIEEWVGHKNDPNDVFYILTDPETGEEFEFDTYPLAIEKQEKLY